MRTLATLAWIALAAVCTLAQDAPDPKPETVDLHFLGVPAEVALSGFAESAGLELRADGSRFELDTPVWLSAKDVTPGHAARLLSQASGLNVCVDEDTVTLIGASEKETNLVVRGYDVSVITGGYVDYVNQYGRAERKQEDDEKPEKSTAAEFLENKVRYIAQHFWGESICGSVVGDRILYTTTPALHERIRELLDLLKSEHGGESEDLKRERAHLDALKQGSGDIDLKERPLASILANLCMEAGAEFFIDPSLVHLYADQHISWTGDGSYHDQAVALLRRENAEGRVASHLGVVYFGLRVYSPRGSERVFEVGELLKKLDTAYQRQRTEPGREEGFDKSLREAGGNDVILKALDWQLFEMGFSDRAETYGTRIIVGGGATTADAAEVILKEMGWEEPGADEAAEAGHAE